VPPQLKSAFSTEEIFLDFFKKFHHNLSAVTPKSKRSVRPRKRTPDHGAAFSSPNFMFSGRYLCSFKRKRFIKAHIQFSFGRSVDDTANNQRLNILC